MSPTEELTYLNGILLEALKWNVTDDDNAVQLEVTDRIKKILETLSNTPKQPSFAASKPQTMTLDLFKYRNRKELSGLSDEEIDKRYTDYMSTAGTDTK